MKTLVLALTLFVASLPASALAAPVTTYFEGEVTIPPPTPAVSSLPAPAIALLIGLLLGAAWRQRRDD